MKTRIRIGGVRDYLNHTVGIEHIMTGGVADARRLRCKAVVKIEDFEKLAYTQGAIGCRLGWKVSSIF